MSEQVKEPEKKSHWLEAFLIGVIALVFGLSVAFFPKMLTSIGFIVAAVVFFGVGITDIIASIKYKSEEGTTKSTLWAGLISVLAGAFMAVTIYVPSIRNRYHCALRVGCAALSFNFGLCNHGQNKKKGRGYFLGNNRNCRHFGVFVQRCAHGLHKNCGLCSNGHWCCLRNSGALSKGF